MTGMAGHDPGISGHVRPESLVTLLRNTQAETEQLLTDRRLCTVVLYSGMYVDIAGPQTPLMQTLESKLFTRHEHLPWRIYVRN
jgi:hypothetical protein